MKNPAQCRVFYDWSMTAYGRKQSFLSLKITPWEWLLCSQQQTFTSCEYRGRLTANSDLCMSTKPAEVQQAHFRVKILAPVT